jgi:hypothetical protein
MLTLKDEYTKQPEKRPGLSIRAVVLLVSLPVLAGLIFVGAKWAGDGKLGNLFSGALASLSNVEIKVDPETAVIAAGSTEPLILKVIATEDGSILKADNTEGTVTSGQGQLTGGTLDETGASVFQYFAAPTPGQVTIDFKYGYTHKLFTVMVFDPTPPSAPTINSPTESAALASSQIRVSGKGRADTKVLILVDGTQAAEGRSNQDGDFNVEVSGLKNGSHSLEAVSQSEAGIKSPKSPPVHITISASGPTLDTRNIIVRPATIKAGATFDVFAPANTNTAKVFVIVGGHQYELKDTNKTSVFSSRLPAPAAAGDYQVDFSLTDFAGNSVMVPNVTHLTVV